MVRSQNGPVSSEVVEVIHDDGQEEVEDLWKEGRGGGRMGGCSNGGKMVKNGGKIVKKVVEGG